MNEKELKPVNEKELKPEDEKEKNKESEYECIALLSTSGFIFPINDFKKRNSPKVFSKLINELDLTHEVRLKNLITRKKIPQFEYVQFKDQNYVKIPRAKGFELYEEGKLSQIKSIISNQLTPILSETRCELILRDNQEKCVNYMMENFLNEETLNSGKGSCVLYMGTGKGKSFILAGLIRQLAQKTLVITTNKYLAGQMKNDLKTCFPDLIIGSLHSDDRIDADIVIAVVKSVVSDKKKTYLRDDDPIIEKYKFTPVIKETKKQGLVYNIMTVIDPLGNSIEYTEYEVDMKSYLKSFGFIVFDEVHTYATPEYSKAFWMTNTRATMGMTASQSARTDCFEDIYKFHLGNQDRQIKEEDIPDYDLNEAKYKGSVTKIKYIGHPLYSRQINNEKLNMPANYEHVLEITKDPFRNLMIIKHIIELYQSGRNIFIFSEYRIHLDFLNALFLYCLTKNNVPANTQKDPMFALNNIFKTISQEKLYNNMVELEKYFSELLLPYTKYNINAIPSTREEESLFNKIKSVTQNHNVVMYGKSGAEIVNHAKTEAYIIFSTWYYSTGTSIVRMDTLIVATPRRSLFDQKAGRITRLGSDEEIERQIIDIVDWNISIKSQFSDRKKEYDRREWPITSVEIDHKKLFPTQYS